MNLMLKTYYSHIPVSQGIFGSGSRRQVLRHIRRLSQFVRSDSGAPTRPDSTAVRRGSCSASRGFGRGRGFPWYSRHAGRPESEPYSLHSLMSVIVLAFAAIMYTNDSETADADV